MFIEFIFVMVKANYLLHHAYERMKLKQKQNQISSHSNWPHILLLNLAHKQCNGIINGWTNCLTSESKGRLLINNIVMFCSAWGLVMVQIHFSLVKKINVGRPEHLQSPHPLHLITFHFCITSHPPQSGCHMCITPKTKVK